MWPFVFPDLVIIFLGLGFCGCRRFCDRKHKLFHWVGRSLIVCSVSVYLFKQTIVQKKIDAKNILFTYSNEVLQKGRRKCNYQDYCQILNVSSH